MNPITPSASFHGRSGWSCRLTTRATGWPSFQSNSASTETVSPTCTRELSPATGTPEITFETS